MYSLWLMMMFETPKHVPKTEERCFVFKNNNNTCAIKTTTLVLSRPLLRAILKESTANYISLERLINVDFGKKK